MGVIHTHTVATFMATIAKPMQLKMTGRVPMKNFATFNIGWGA